MKSRDVILTRRALQDLSRIGDWVASRSSGQTSILYIRRIARFLASLEFAAERGLLREDIQPGLRLLGFERRIQIALKVYPDRVTVLRVFYGGQDWERALKGNVDPAEDIESGG